jgi:hypothetical protein
MYNYKMHNINTLKTETKIFNIAVFVHLIYSVGYIMTSVFDAIWESFFQVNIFSDYSDNTQNFISNPTVFIISNFIFGIFVLILGAKIATEINQEFIQNEQKHFPSDQLALMTTLPFWSNFAIPNLLLLSYGNLSLKLPKSFSFIKYGLILNAILFGFYLVTTFINIFGGKISNSYFQSVISVVNDITPWIYFLNLILVILVTRQVTRISKAIQLNRNMVVKN